MPDGMPTKMDVAAEKERILDALGLVPGRDIEEQRRRVAAPVLDEVRTVVLEMQAKMKDSLSRHRRRGEYQYEDGALAVCNAVLKALDGEKNPHPIGRDADRRDDPSRQSG